MLTTNFPRVILLGFVLVAMSFFLIGRPNAEEDRSTTCHPSDNCTIEYRFLANQQSDPFLYHGRLVNSSHSRWRQYKRFLSDFGDTRDCLTESEARTEHPNVLLIDWAETGTGRGAQVCTFLIFRSIGTPEGILQWLKLHNFNVGEITNFRGEGFTPYYANEPVSNLTALWEIQTYREVNPSMANTLFGLETVSSFQLVIYFSEGGTVVGVDTVTNTKFN